MNRKISFDFVAAFWRDLSEAQKNALVEYPSRVAAFLGDLAREIEERTFVTPLSDDEVTTLLVHYKGYF